MIAQGIALGENTKYYNPNGLGELPVIDCNGIFD